MEQRRSLGGVQFQWRRALGSPSAVAGWAVLGALAGGLGGIGTLTVGAISLVDLGLANTPWLALGLCVAVLTAGGVTLWAATRRPEVKLTLSGAGLRIDDGPIVPYGPTLVLEFLLHDGSGVARASREVMEANRTELVKGSVSSGLDAIIGGKRVALARRITADQALVLADAIRANWPKKLPSVQADSQGDAAELRALNRLRAGATATD